jgi:hypothetical protein
MSSVIIGKIPGYNGNISKDIKYENRLLNNLTEITLSPTGYNINFSILSDIMSNKKKNTSIYKIGGDLSALEGAIEGKDKSGQTINTKNAIAIWNQICDNQQFSKDSVTLTEKSLLPQTESLKILCTNDSTMTEVFNNDFGKSGIEELADNKISSALGKTVKSIGTIKNLATGVDSQTGQIILKGASFGESDLLSMLAGKALGLQTSLPKEWKSSSYNNALQVMVKLVSPSGDTKSILKYIVRPLMYLIAASSPVTYNGVSFGYPPLWEVKADGAQNMVLAAISTMTITRGGNETQFNRFNQPMNIDIRLNIEPLINSYATAMKSSLYVTDKSSRKMLVTNAQDTINSFNFDKKTNKVRYKEMSINLSGT